jgi:ligand-binding sensor domain-containing protein
LTNEVVRIDPTDDELTGLTSRITGFLQDQSGLFWIGTFDGLFSYDAKSGLFFLETAGGLLSDSTRIYQMTHGEESIWLATGLGLVKIDLSPAKEHKHYDLEFNDPSVEMVGLLTDQLGQVWVQTREGLYCFLGEEMGMVRVLNAGGFTHSLALNPIEPLLEDRDGFIWYGTFGNGIYQINPSTLTYKHYLNNPADPQSLAENSINCIFQDRSGALWFGTFGAGVSILDPQSNRFSLFKNNPFNANSPASSFVWTIFETSDKSCD